MPTAKWGGKNNLIIFYNKRLGRLAAHKWAIRHAEIAATRALQYAAATAVQRVWRGVIGRREADVKATEMADFIAMIRKKEAALVEEEYWRNNTWARLKRDFKQLINPVPAKDMGASVEEDDARRADEEERLRLEEEEDKKWIFDYDEGADAFKSEIGLYYGVRNWIVVRCASAVIVIVRLIRFSFLRFTSTRLVRVVVLSWSVMNPCDFHVVYVRTRTRTRAWLPERRYHTRTWYQVAPYCTSSVLVRTGDYAGHSLPP